MTQRICTERIGAFMVLAFLFGCGSMTLQGKAGSTIAWDFQGGAGSEWSTGRTFDLGGNKVLGLFNDQNKKYPSSAVLRLSGIPPSTPLSLSFDLYFVGSWDSGGELADRWTLSVDDGATLIDMKQFDSAYHDGAFKRPRSKTGRLDTGRRMLDYWSVDNKVTITPDQFRGGEVALVFRGYLTGRGTEFWALDNVQVTLGAAPRSP